MIYLLGGAPRCGKSLLAHQLNQRRGVYIVSTDLLRGVLMPIDAELREMMLKHDPVDESRVFHRHLRQAIACLRLQQADTLIEGVGFLPRQIPQLSRELGIEIRCCFLGRSAANPGALFSHETDNRYYEGLDPTRQERFAAEVVEWTRLIETDCQQHGLPFVDLSARPFAESLRVAEVALLSQ